MIIIRNPKLSCLPGETSASSVFIFYDHRFYSGSASWKSSHCFVSLLVSSAVLFCSARRVLISLFSSVSIPAAPYDSLFEIMLTGMIVYHFEPISKFIWPRRSSAPLIEYYMLATLASHR